MPVTFDENLSRALYHTFDRETGEPIIGYTRRFAQQFQEGGLAAKVAKRRGFLIPRGIAQNQSVLVVGCGFGWLIEDLIDQGFTTVFGVESGPYIHANKATEARADVSIVEATVDSTNAAQAAIQAAGGPAKFSWVIDEDAAPAHPDAELPAFFAGCERLLQGNQTQRIIHLVSPLSESGVPGDSSQNWKSLADWKELAPGHTWIDVRDGTVA